MKIFDSANPLFTATAVGNVVSFVPNTQGTPVPQISITGGAHLVPTLLTAATRNSLQWVPTYDTLTFSGVVATDAVIINGTTFTCVASGATGTQFNVGGSDTLTAANFITVYTTWSKTGRSAIWRVADAKVAFACRVAEPTNLVSVTATVGIEVSVDGVGFITHPQQTNFSLTGTSPQFTMGQSVDGYPFMRANVSAMTGVGAGVIVHIHSEYYD